MIDERLVQEALLRVGTDAFERFGQSFYGALQDRDFLPLGGVHDGGADGFVELFGDEDQTNYVQITKQATTEKKIRDTVKRLREYDRNPKVVTLLTSQVVKDIDKIQSKLSLELAVKIHIRDAKFIIANINSVPSIEQAFHSYLEPSIQYLYRPGNLDGAGGEIGGVDRTLAVFMRQEVLNRKGSAKLIEPVADSLILWALRDTDPNAKILLTRDEILGSIETVLPTAKQFIRGVLDIRLQVLARKDAPGGRQIRIYKKEQAYCLPYETRQLVAVENATDDLLKLQTSCVFEERAASAYPVDFGDGAGEVADMCHKVLEAAFESQGVSLIQFVSEDAELQEITLDLGAVIDAVVTATGTLGDRKILLRNVLTTVLRGTFYRSTEVERQYLSKLSRTYVLMLLIRNEPKIVEYFSSMASNFRLYVGSDLLIRAISEQYLETQSQYTVNLFEILRAAGSVLILTQKVVEEVATHIRRQIFEFENHYALGERYITLDDLHFIDRLLIRSYFAAKLSPVPGVKAPRSWRTYIEGFAGYDRLVSRNADDELAAYLLKKFGMKYETTTELEAGLDERTVQELTDVIHKHKIAEFGKDNRVLAFNDALHVLRVYRCREVGQESNPASPFGFKTWWLTQDAKVRRACAELVRANQGSRFMMRPELLLHYIGLNPSLSEVRDSYAAVFPSVLGVRLASHLDSEVFKRVLKDAVEVSSIDPARAFAMVRQGAQSLLHDPNRQT